MTITPVTTVGLICLTRFSASPARSENVELSVVCAERYLNENSSPDAKDRLQACRFYLLYRHKGLSVPERLKPHLTDQNLQKIFGSY